ncbi:MAG: DUF2007 domain-containing protein [Acidobacteria bacterium]|nr:DUF2007 domain-containing protein [Acidobacteriota bacterium]
MRVVPLTRVPDPFHARVLAARLGSEGILTQLRGGIDSPYPMGDIEVLVSEDDLDLARELLLVDEIESAFDAPSPDEHRPPRTLPAWAVALVLLGLGLFAYAHTIPQR